MSNEWYKRELPSPGTKCLAWIECASDFHEVIIDFVDKPKGVAVFSNPIKPGNQYEWGAISDFKPLEDEGRDSEKEQQVILILTKILESVGRGHEKNHCCYERIIAEYLYNEGLRFTNN